jgi:soluble lytic murein transglycosylase-like protein
VSGLNAIGAVQARIGSIEQLLGIARPVAAAATRSTTAASATAASSVASIDASGIDTSGSFEQVAASIEAALGVTTQDTTPLTSVGLTASSTSTSSLAASTPYADLFQQAGVKYGIDPTVLAGVAYVESRFQTGVVSSAGAVGMMQFMPSTAASLGVDPTDPASAIDGAARYLRTQIDRFGSLEMALAAYNVGPGAMAAAGSVQPGSQAERYVTAVMAATGRV